MSVREKLRLNLMYKYRLIYLRTISLWQYSDSRSESVNLTWKCVAYFHQLQSDHINLVDDWYTYDELRSVANIKKDLKEIVVDILNLRVEFKIEIKGETFYLLH